MVSDIESVIQCCRIGGFENNVICVIMHQHGIII